MKKNFIIAAMLLFAGASLMTGCNKEEGQVFHLSIKDQPAHKTSLGAGYTTLWQNNDVIYINGVENALTVTAEGQDAWTAPDVTIDPINSQFYAFYAGDATDVSSSISTSAQSYSFTMPESYTYIPTNLHSPMAGIGTYTGTNPNTRIDVSFQNLFALLELEVPIASANASYSISITEQDENNVPLSGDFQATFNGTTWTTTCVSNGSNSLTVTKNTTETKVYIPIPAGNHKLDIYINAASHNTMVNSSYNFQAGKYYKISTMAVGDTTIIPYPFIIGDTVLFFGKGNLAFHQANNPQWALEPNQWDTTTYVASNKQAVHSSQIAWMPSADAQPQDLNNGGTVTGPYYPQGYASLLGLTGDNLNHWRVPSRNQWSSILGLGTTNPNWAYVRISYTKNGTSLVQNGLIIVTPDAPLTGTSIVKGQTYTGSTAQAAWSNVPTITSAQFETLEEYGCVFLPAYGYVNHRGSSGTWSNDYQGYYRTCEPVAAGGSGAYAYVLHFTPTASPNFLSTIQFGEGVSVRLFYFEVSSSNTDSK